MSYIFQNATLLTYDLNKNYSNGDNLLINTTKNIRLNGILDNRATNQDGEGVAQTFSGINEIFSYNTGQYEAIVINGYYLGSGRIVNISLPTENPIYRGEYVYTIEIVETGNFSLLPQNSIYGSALSSITEKVLSINEGLNFNYSQNGKYSYDHNLDIQFYNNDSDIIEKSKNLATLIFNDTGVYVGLFGKFSGFYNNLIFKQNIIQENYDLIAKSASFTKSIEIDENYKDLYSLELTNSCSLNQDGIVTVNENGKIKFLGNTDVFLAKDYLDAEISGSYNRCNQIAINTFSSNLATSPINLGITFEKFNNIASYEVTYTDNPIYYSGISHTYEINFETNNDNITVYTRNGSIRLINDTIGQITSGSNGFLEYKNIYREALHSYGNYKLTNASMNFSIVSGTVNIQGTYGKSLDYSISKTDDKFILNDNRFFRTLEVENQSDDLSLMTKEYIIANKDDKNFYFSSGLNVEQSQLATDSVVVKGVLNRPTGINYIWNSGFINPYTPELKKKVLDNISKIGSDYIINGASLTYDSNLAYGINLNILSVKPK